MKRRHCAEACGNERTRRIVWIWVPGGATRFRWTSRTTSRWMSSSTSKTRLSSGRTYGSLDRVLDRKEPEIDLA